MRLNDQWCDKHWAPYKERGLRKNRPNGIVASLEMMQRYVQEHGKGLKPAELNTMMALAPEPVCCTMGDRAMAEILELASK